MILKSGFFIFCVLNLFSCGRNPMTGSSFQSDQPNQAGVIDGQVVMELQSKAARSVIAVELIDKNREILTYCTGVLIGAHTVLTAAHCFSDLLIPGVVSFNIIFETRTKFLKMPRRREGFSHLANSQYNTDLKKWIYVNNKYIDPQLHPEYKDNGTDVSAYSPQGDHDLAVLVFKGSIPSGYEPVNIDTDVGADYAGNTVYFYGFGRARDYLDPDGKYDTSAGQLRKGEAIIDTDFNRYSDRYFTAKTSKNSLCQGDSGGPQFYNEKGVLKIIGINSAVSAEESSVPVDPSIVPGNFLSCRGRSQLAKVAPFAKWIKATEQQLLQKMK